MSTLFIVSTPIGNLADITFRAVETLKNVDLILAEDTRTSLKLTTHYEIKKPFKSYHDFNKEKITPILIGELKNGKTMALITDAGTPGVADPAFYIVRSAIENNIPVIPIPGAAAFTTALVASGLPTDRFLFENFLPPKSSRRKTIFTEFLTEKRTVIFYETPHRILKVLKEMDEILGDVEIVIGRELTKIHEEFLRGTAKTILAHYEKRTPKGEMVVLFNSRIKWLNKENPDNIIDSFENSDVNT